MLVKEIMNTDVKTIGPDATIQEAAKRMDELNIGCFVVTENDHMAGIITERDLLKKVVAKAKDSSRLKVKDVMVKRVIMIDPEADVSDAVDVMNQHGIKKLPVLHGSNLVGIITATDIVNAQPKMIESLSELFVFKKKHSVAG